MPVSGRFENHVRGLTAGDTKFFGSLRMQGCLLVYDSETMQEKRALELPRYDRTSLAPDGCLWALASTH